MPQQRNRITSRDVGNSSFAGISAGTEDYDQFGTVEKNMSVSVRGTGTIGSGSNSSPLILIDGMVGDINTVNPQDIENISVLKDAAASSIYGSRAPFGVILVTTKKGQSGKVSVNYNNSFRISSPINMPKAMDSYSFAVMMNYADANRGIKGAYTDETMRKMVDFRMESLRMERSGWMLRVRQHGKTVGRWDMPIRISGMLCTKTMYSRRNTTSALRVVAKRCLIMLHSTIWIKKDL